MREGRLGTKNGYLRGFWDKWIEEKIKYRLSRVQEDVETRGESTSRGGIHTSQPDPRGRKIESPTGAGTLRSIASTFASFCPKQARLRSRKRNAVGTTFGCFVYT